MTLWLLAGLRAKYTLTGGMKMKKELIEAKIGELEYWYREYSNVSGYDYDGRVRYKFLRQSSMFTTVLICLGVATLLAIILRNPSLLISWSVTAVAFLFFLMHCSIIDKNASYC